MIDVDMLCYVGGGPTGVEFAAELHDLLNTDIKRHFPGLHNLARISLFDVAPTILGSFDEGLQEYVRFTCLIFKLISYLFIYAIAALPQNGSSVKVYVF